MGGSLQALTNHYNKTVTAVAGKQGLHNKVERFKQLSAKASKAFPESLDVIGTENEADRLQLILETDKSQEK